MRQIFLCKLSSIFFIIYSENDVFIKDAVEELSGKNLKIIVCILKKPKSLRSDNYESLFKKSALTIIFKNKNVKSDIEKEFQKTVSINIHYGGKLIFLPAFTFLI